MKDLVRNWGWNLRPWSGLIGGTAGWFISQQTGTILIQDRCQEGSALAIILICLCGLAVAIGGGFLSYHRRRDAEVSDARQFIGLLSAMAAALMSVAIFYQLLAGLIVPRCFG